MIAVNLIPGNRKEVFFFELSLPCYWNIDILGNIFRIYIFIIRFNIFGDDSKTHEYFHSVGGDIEFLLIPYHDIIIRIVLDEGFIGIGYATAVSVVVYGIIINNQSDIFLVSICICRAISSFAGS